MALLTMALLTMALLTMALLTMALLTMALLTMALLTMALLTMALLTMALLTMALLIMALLTMALLTMALLTMALLTMALLTMAGHACGQLTDFVIDACIEAQVDFAVMPCCHRDLRTANQMQIVAKSLGVSKSGLIDVARLGAIVARGFDCRWRTIDKTITPENRILVGLARPKVSEQVDRKKRYRALRLARCTAQPCRAHPTFTTKTRHLTC
jgi:hypothetical protein